MPPTSAVVAVLAAAVVVSGCARVSDPPAGTERSGTVAAPAARQFVSADFGERPIIDEPIADGRSALDALRATTPVETAYGGGFVAGMHGLTSSTSPRRDWTYLVNGVAPGVGAADYAVRPGDRVWWDYHAWGDGPAPAVAVGSWPEPFVNGYPRSPASVRADPPLAGALRAAGARVTAASSEYRVLVGASADLAVREPAWRRALADPTAAGLSARIVGGRVERLGPDGARMVTVPGARAVAVAMLAGPAPESGGVVMVVAGLDRAAARRAAARIADDPQILAGRFAVVFDATGTPIASAGRTTP